MSVPLDRLYDFLESLCNRDVLIYRFYPHGSRNLEDCKPSFESISNVKRYSDMLKLQILICHDQEPLNFDFFNADFNIQSPKNKQRDPFRGRVIYYDYFNIHDKVMLCHSELNSPEVEKFKQHGCIDVYYWAHALIARDWFRYAKYDTKMLNKDHVQKTFLIYNRAWTGTREYRLKFSELLVQNNLVSQCLTKFNPVDQDIHYKDHKFKNSSFLIENYNLQNYFEPNFSDPAISAEININDYVSTEIEVVLETLFDDTRNHLTEKSLRPIACGQPFILASTPGSLEYLKKYGFETFSSVFDESYDKESNPLSRLQKIVSLMNNIKNLSESEKKQLRSIALRNKQRFFSEEFQQCVINEFKENLQSAMIEIKNHCCASFLKHQEQFLDLPWVPSLLVNFTGQQEYYELMSYVESTRG